MSLPRYEPVGLSPWIYRLQVLLRLSVDEPVQLRVAARIYHLPRIFASPSPACRWELPLDLLPYEFCSMLSFANRCSSVGRLDFTAGGEFSFPTVRSWHAGGSLPRTICTSNLGVSLLSNEPVQLCLAAWIYRLLSASALALPDIPVGVTPRLMASA